MQVRKFVNNNGEIYTVIKGGEVGKAILLAKHSDPDGFDFVVGTNEGNSWWGGDYFQTIEEALEAYEKRG